MSKYDEVLNELVYRIDDVVYSFYSESNEIIANKRSQERLLTFRDNTLNTINDMNVRSLEIISGFKNRDLIDERAETLLSKNESIVASALEVLEAAPNRSDFLEEVNVFASSVLDSAKEVINKVDASGTVDKIVDVAQDGFKKAKYGLDEFAHNPKVIEGTKVLKEKTKDAVDLGSKLVKDGSQKLADWISELDKSKNDETESNTPEED